MISIELKNIGKRFNHSWIIRNASFSVFPNEILALSGSNGSGKSTLLKIISSALTPSRGTITYSLNGQNIKDYNLFKYLSFSAPYLSLIEELSVKESITFHTGFKKFRQNFSTNDVLTASLLEAHASKSVKDLSSGMLQRLKLALAILSDSHLLLLDEPTSYLDQHGKSWYHTLLSENLSGRTVIIASNEPEDLQVCQRRFQIEDFKKKSG